MVEELLGYKVTNCTVSECVFEIAKSISRRYEKTWLACLNPHSYAVALNDDEFSQALRSASWLVPDGVGVVLGSRLLGGNVKERIAGADIFAGVCGYLNEVRGSVFFLGSKDETLSEILRNLKIDYPNIVVSGTYSPPFKDDFSDEDVAKMIDAVNRSGADVLWVGMTAPKQEKWIARHFSRLDVKFIGAIGAVFDFYSGIVPRSHPIFRRLGLEWLPRLIRQPKRLWRRMFVSAPIFVAHVVCARALKIFR